MRRGLALLLVVVALPASSAQARTPAAEPQARTSHTLGVVVARRYLHRHIARYFNYTQGDPVAPGANLYYCGRRSGHYVTCDVLVRTVSDEFWCGGGYARLLADDDIITRFNLGRYGCEYF